ncbi:unnamed protein product [Rhizophagus irregularis]|uniref:Uncharacterized protein n=1 Tax=Rhizophagus irregularis TaxID=588596 RepID=A0A2N1NF74_9GLOM|nr:hypothetical protein RhiirC2_710306 [Rhizophagus irregularis]CAB5380494.1 unnamed protein product [Rhizophagus irregularis]
MTGEERFINGKSIASYLQKYYRRFDRLKENFIQGFYDIDYDIDSTKFDLEEYERLRLGNRTIIPPGELSSTMLMNKFPNRRIPILYAVLFAIKLGSEHLKKILNDIKCENSSKSTVNKEPIKSSQSHNKEISREWEEKKLALEKKLEEQLNYKRKKSRSLKKNQEN